MTIGGYVCADVGISTNSSESEITKTNATLTIKSCPMEASLKEL